MKPSQSTRRWLLLGAGLGVIGGLLFWGRPRPLSALLHEDAACYQVDVTLLRSLPMEQPDGSITYVHPRADLTAAPGSPPVQALAEAMGQLSCRRRIWLPMETPTLYRTGADSLSISLKAEDQLVDLHLLSDSSALYDLASNRTYRVEDGCFAVWGEVVEAYGVPGQ